LETLPETGACLYLSFTAGHKRQKSVLLKMLAMKGLNNFETTEVIKNSIFS